MKINAEKPVVKEWLATLSAAAKGERYQKLWKRIYRLVEVPARKRRSINISKLEITTKEGENVIVPGKVLSNGKISHRINIAAMEFSDSALKSLKDANCNVVSIKDMVSDKSRSVRVIV